jgi:ABC-type amino acid transport substrate-binding protein
MADSMETESRIKVISGIINEQTHAMVKEVLRVAYNRIGCEVRFALYPGIRSLELANKGQTDGDIARISGTGNKFPNLRPISTPVIHFQGVVFTKTLTQKILSWEDLKGLRVGVIRGIRYSTIETKGLSPFFSKDMTHLFKLLENNRIQVAIAALQAGTIELYKNFNNSDIHITGTPLYAAPLYHFIHIKNQRLIEQLERVLKEMDQTGEMQHILDETFQKLMNE